MRSVEDFARVAELLRRGLNDCDIARRTGVPRTTVRDWRRGRRAREPRVCLGVDRACVRCGEPAHDFAGLPGEPYSYLLGLYLGDGHLALSRKKVWHLRIFLDLRYPGIVDECATAMQSLFPSQPAGRYWPRDAAMVVVYMWSKQWGCLIPQHGRGPKHRRLIQLADWQQRHVDRHPEALLRGLIHSDGWRGTNVVTARRRRYRYPRYTFCNVSSDIRAIFCQACDKLGIEWRQMNERNISVAKRGSVERLDGFIGRKR